MKTKEEEKKQLRIFHLSVLLVFLGFILIFITFKDGIDSFNKTLFSFTDELDVKEIKIEYVDMMPKAGTATKAASSGTQASIDYSKPVLKDLPKTEEPTIAFVDSAPDFLTDNIPLFPKLRQHTGEEWNVEKTDVKMATDGKKLYIFLKCYDKDPSKLVTSFSRDEGAASTWKDDSVELFIMKDAKSDFYIQYIPSASGIFYAYYMKNGEQANVHTTEKIPENFVTPDCDVQILPDCFEVFMTIDMVNNFGIKKLNPGDKILVQIVRNYRGRTENGIGLQLFPNHIYSDSRTGANNHDRRSFMPAAIKIPEKAVAKAVDDTETATEATKDMLKETETESVEEKEEGLETEKEEIKEEMDSDVKTDLDTDTDTDAEADTDTGDTDMDMETETETDTETPGLTENEKESSKD